MTSEYRKFYSCQPLTVRELKTLDLVDRIRYMVKRVPRPSWPPRQVRDELLKAGLICDLVTLKNIEDEMQAFYG